MRIGFFRRSRKDSGYRNLTVNNVVRDLDVNRAFMAQTCLDAPNNLGSSALLIEENGARNGDFVVNTALCFERFDLVMQQRILFPIFPPGSAAHDDNRRFLGVRTGDRIQNIQSAYAVSHANQTDPVNARIGVGRKTSGGLVRHSDALDFRFLEPCKCRQSKIARNAETVANTPAVKVFEKKLPQRHRGWKRFEPSARRRSYGSSRGKRSSSIATGEADPPSPKRYGGASSFSYRYSRIR